jgi:hypothetical protein
MREMRAMRASFLPSGPTMEKVYDQLKLLTNQTIIEIREHCILKIAESPMVYGVLKHQCEFALIKRSEGAWKEPKENKI